MRGGSVHLSLRVTNGSGRDEATWGDDILQKPE
jgi:hypothetical protein